jgi:glutathione S-transferase
MPYIHIVIGLALVQFLWFGLAVAGARVRYKIAAPAVTGHDIFERYLRVQMNTLEQLVVFIPSILLFSQYWSPYVAAGLGVIFLIGRVVYFFAYVRDPKSRELGFILTIGPNVALLGGALLGSGRAAFYH